MRHRCTMRFVFGICAVLLVLSVQPSNAQSKPSVESCTGLGMLDVQCYNCETGEYLGKINVTAGYNEDAKDCMRDIGEARGRCSGAYGVAMDKMGMKWKYRIGMTDWRNWYPRSNCPCVEW